MSWLPRKQVVQVDLAAFDGTRAVYDFTYREVLVSRSCKDDDPDNDGPNGDRIVLPHLTRIDLPDGSYYEMAEAGQPRYYNTCRGGNGGCARSAARHPPADRRPDRVGLRRAQLSAPAGRVRLVRRGRRAAPPRRDGRAGGHLDLSPPEPDGSRERALPRGGPRPADRRLQAALLRHPVLGLDGVADTGWQYGLPFTWTEELDGLYLSTETFDSSSGDGCAGALLRSTWVAYRHDQLPRPDRSGEPAAVAGHQPPGSSGAVSSITTIPTPPETPPLGSRPPGASRPGTAASGPRRRPALSQLELGHDEERVRRTDYDLTDEVYDPGEPGHTWGGSPVPVSTPWLLDLHDSIEVAEGEAFGETVRRTLFDRDRTDGFLNCARVLADGASLGERTTC